MRHTFGWDLPPGVTDADIDRHFGEPPDDDPEPMHERPEPYVPITCANCGLDRGDVMELSRMLTIADPICCQVSTAVTREWRPLPGYSTAGLTGSCE